MKKFTFITLYLLLMTLTCMAQTGNLDAVRQKIAEFNKKLPLTTDKNCTLEKIIIEDGYVVQYGTCISTFNEEGKTLLRTWGENYLEQAKNKNVRLMYQEYMKAGLGVKQIMKFKDTGKSESFALTVSDIKRMLSFPADASSLLLEEIRAARESLPFAASVGIICSAYEFPKQDLIMRFDVDETYYSMETLQANISNTKQTFLSGIKAGTSESIQMAKMCVNAGYGMGFIYVGKKSGKKAELIMTYQELKACFD